MGAYCLARAGFGLDWAPTVTVAELRKMLVGVPDDMVVVRYDESWFVRAEEVAPKKLFKSDGHGDFTDWDCDCGEDIVFVID